MRRWSRTHIRDIRRITRTTRTTLSPRPHNCLRISIIISPVLILSIFNVSDIKKIIPQLWQSVLVYCLIILRNYQLVYTWPLIFINIDNERVEASWGPTEPVDYILLKILTKLTFTWSTHITDHTTNRWILAEYVSFYCFHLVLFSIEMIRLVLFHEVCKVNLFRTKALLLFKQIYVVRVQCSDQRRGTLWTITPTT